MAWSIPAPRDDGQRQAGGAPGFFQLLEQDFHGQVRPAPQGAFVGSACLQLFLARTVSVLFAYRLVPRRSAAVHVGFVVRFVLIVAYLACASWEAPDRR